MNMFMYDSCVLGYRKQEHTDRDRDRDRYRDRYRDRDRDRDTGLGKLPGVLIMQSHSGWHIRDEKQVGKKGNLAITARSLSRPLIL